MRRLIAGFALFLVGAAGCEARSGTILDAPPADRLLFHPLPGPSPFVQVTVGPVQALVPDRWDSAVLTGHDTLPEGLVASPRLDAWKRMDGRVQGMAAVWLDVARVGIPTDYYYLAASGPVLQALTHREGCRHSYHRVIVDHRPMFAGFSASPGDYVARGAGVCMAGDTANRWAYFVAAPGFGPVREMGIPNSGLYVVVAVVHDSPDAARQLRNMLMRARFGNASVSDLIQAARLSAGQV